MEDAAKYYNQKRDGLGSEFAEEIYEGLASIAERPKQGIKMNDAGTIRKRKIKRFPYGIVFSGDENEVLVLAIMHDKRRRGYWEGRLPASTD